MRRLGCVVLLIGLAVAAFIGFRFVYGWSEQGPATQDVSVIVPEGSTLSDAAVLLKQAGAVRSADAFLTRAKVFGAGKSIKAGEFTIPAGASEQSITLPVDGQAIHVRFQLGDQAEGLRLRSIELRPVKGAPDKAQF